MTRESKIICRNQFKNTDAEVSKAEFNRKLALLISSAENLRLNNEEKLHTAEESAGYGIINRS